MSQIWCQRTVRANGKLCGDVTHTRSRTVLACMKEHEVCMRLTFISWSNLLCIWSLCSLSLKLSSAWARCCSFCSRRSSRSSWRLRICQHTTLYHSRHHHKHYRVEMKNTLHCTAHYTLHEFCSDLQVCLDREVCRVWRAQTRISHFRLYDFIHLKSVVLYYRIKV